MDGVIDFSATGSALRGAPGSHQAAAAAMRRYVPHTVAWRCQQAGDPIAVILPENLSVSDLVRRAAHAHIELAVAEDPAAPDRAFELYYAHLGEDEIVEGIRRLGYCLARYSELAARWPGQPASVVGI